jgi:adenosylmethionine-8-amino-7-oxononanoate aminotransferase
MQNTLSSSVYDARQRGLGNYQDQFFSASTIPLPNIVRARGIRLWDDQGREFLDSNSGAVVANIGHGNERVLDAMAKQGRELTFTYVRFGRHQPNIELSARIAELAGPGFERVHLANDGSEANEMAIKFLRMCAYRAGKPAKRKVISLMPSYHGGTVATMLWSGDTEYTAVYGDMGVPSTKVAAPLTYRRPPGTTVDEAGLLAARQLEEAIVELGSDNVLAFIMEPVGGAATGANVPPPIYFEEVRRICDRHDVFLVFDEVMSATRTGTFLAAHHNPRALPDAAVMAKGIGAGYAPLGAVAVSADLVDRLTAVAGFDLSHTYNANPIACAAGCAVLDEVVEHDLIQNGARMGLRLTAALQSLMDHHDIIGDVRGRGMLIGVELVADRETKTAFPSSASAASAIRLAGIDHGLLMGGRRTNGGVFGEWIMIAPPLIASEADIDEIVERFDQTLGAVNDGLRAAAKRANA